MTLIDPAFIEPLLLACLEKDPVNLQRVNETHVKRVTRAINRATTTKPATVREPIITKEFLAACHDITRDAQREHLIVGYGFQYRKGTDLYAFHHVTGAERHVQIPDYVREEIHRHHRHRTDAEVIVFHNHPRTGQEPAWFYTLKAFLNDVPIASSADRGVLETHQFSPLGLVRQFLGQGQVHFYLGVTLGCLIVRGGYAHPFNPLGHSQSPPTRWHYALDSGADAVFTMVTVLLCQAVASKVAPEIGTQRDPIYRAISLGMVVLAAMRMAMRPRCEFQMPFKDSKLNADQIYKRTWWMNMLWIAGFQGIIMSNPFLPDWFPMHDFFSTFIPAKIFINWIQIQQNKLIRRDKIETVFGMHWAKKRQVRQREVLMKGVKRGEPFYYGYLGLQVFLFAYMAIPVVTALSPWLSGDVENRDVYTVLFRLAIWISLLWSWDYLKRANRAASDAMQQDIDSDRIPDVTPWWRRAVRWFRRTFKSILNRTGVKGYELE